MLRQIPGMDYKVEITPQMIEERYLLSFEHSVPFSVKAKGKKISHLAVEYSTFKIWGSGTSFSRYKRLRPIFDKQLVLDQLRERFGIKTLLELKLIVLFCNPSPYDSKRKFIARNGYIWVPKAYQKILKPRGDGLKNKDYIKRIASNPYNYKLYTIREYERAIKPLRLRGSIEVDDKKAVGVKKELAEAIKKSKIQSFIGCVIP